MSRGACDVPGWRRGTSELAAAYRRAGRLAWHFARGKLRHDPPFAGLLRLGLIPSGAGVVDPGCGQGVLSAWLHAAAARFDAGDWPAGWPQPPRGLRRRGVERMRRDVERARAALGDKADSVQGDMRAADLRCADAVMLFDVLHYIEVAEQDALLRRVHAGLPPVGCCCCGSAMPTAAGAFAAAPGSTAWPRACAVTRRCRCIAAAWASGRACCPAWASTFASSR